MRWQAERPPPICCDLLGSQVPSSSSTSNDRTRNCLDATIPVATGSRSGDGQSTNRTSNSHLQQDLGAAMVRAITCKVKPECFNDIFSKTKSTAQSPRNLPIGR